MAIHDLGHEAVSFTGSQAGIVTDGSHTKAKIVEVRAERIHTALEEDKIVLVAGFQGVSTSTNDVTTLGRGGSDTTAVALAAALGADACEIFTDVAGVFTADPRIVPTALKLDQVTYEEMLEMSASGAKVMMARSIEIARSYGVKLRVRSTFVDGEGTWIGEEDERMLEKAIISGVTHDTSEAKVSIIGIPDRPGVAAKVFRDLARAGVNIDMIVQNVSQDGAATITFTLPKTDVPIADPILDALAAELGANRIERDPDIAKVSLIGAGMKSHPGVAADMFDALADAGINIEIISTSSIRVSCVIRASQVERAVQGGARAVPGIRAGARRWLNRPASASSGQPAPSARSRSTCCASAATRTCASSPRARVRPAGSSGGCTVEEATPEALSRGDVDIFLFSVGTSASRELVPHAVDGGAVAIDKSSAYRLEPGVPLVVPEVNAGRALEHDGIVANPNCCTIPLTCVLKPLHDAAGLVRVRVATYQSVSGAGAQSMERLRNEPQAEHDLRMDWEFDGEEFDEESKLRAETQKIMELPELPIQATCVRVPVMVGHAEAVWIETEDDLTPEQAHSLLGAAPSVQLEEFPSPGKAVGIDDVLVGRIRRDPTVARGLALFLASDNLRKGAALNAIQIAELVLHRERAAACTRTAHAHRHARSVLSRQLAPACRRDPLRRRQRIYCAADSHR